MRALYREGFECRHVSAMYFCPSSWTIDLSEGLEYNKVRTPIVMELQNVPALKSIISSSIMRFVLAFLKATLNVLPKTLGICHSTTFNQPFTLKTPGFGEFNTFGLCSMHTSACLHIESHLIGKIRLSGITYHLHTTTIVNMIFISITDRLIALWPRFYIHETLKI